MNHDSNISRLPRSGERNCDREKLSALLDGELTDAERDGVLAHLETCEACRTYFAELNALRDALGGMEEIDAPEGFAAGVMARLHESADKDAWVAPKPRRRTWRRWAGMAACAAVVLLAVTLPRMRMGGASGATADSTAPSESMYLVTNNAPAAAAEAAGGGSVGAELYATMDAGGDAETEEAATNSELDEAAAALPKEAAERSAGTDGTARLTTAEAADSPVLTLSGEGAEEWLMANGEPLGDGRWRVSVEAVNALPDTLSLVGLQEPADGALVVTLAETEAAP